MKILIIATPRCGGYTLHKELAKTYNLTAIHEPKWKGLDKKFRADSCVKTIVYDNTLEELISLAAKFDKVILLDRKDKVVREGCKPPIHDFSLTDANGNNYTDSLFANKGYKLILVQLTVDGGRAGLEKQMALLADDCKKDQKEFWALTATSPDKLEEYKKRVKAL